MVLVVINLVNGYSFDFFNNYICTNLSFFNDFNYSLLIGVLLFLIIAIIYLIRNDFIFKNFKLVYGKAEFSCASIPIVLILYQINPSLGLLYLNNLINVEGHLTVKIVGHQWYWEYKVLDLGSLRKVSIFDSYIIVIRDAVIREKFDLNNSIFDYNNLGDFQRVIRVDNRLVLPVNVRVKFLVTSADVIHSFSLPNFNLKLDAIAGIINRNIVHLRTLGLFTGACREVCGVGHSNIPIRCERSRISSFLNHYSLGF